MGVANTKATSDVYMRATATGTVDKEAVVTNVDATVQSGAMRSNVDANVQSGAVRVEAHPDAVRTEGNGIIHSGAFAALGALQRIVFEKDDTNVSLQAKAFENISISIGGDPILATLIFLVSCVASAVVVFARAPWVCLAMFLVGMFCFGFCGNHGFHRFWGGGVNLKRNSEWSQINTMRDCLLKMNIDREEWQRAFEVGKALICQVSLVESQDQQIALAFLNKMAKVVPSNSSVIMTTFAFMFASQQWLSAARMYAKTSPYGALASALNNYNIAQAQPSIFEVVATSLSDDIDAQELTEIATLILVTQETTRAELQQLIQGSAPQRLHAQVKYFVLQKVASAPGHVLESIELDESSAPELVLCNFLQTNKVSIADTQSFWTALGRNWAKNLSVATLASGGKVADMVSTYGKENTMKAIAEARGVVEEMKEPAGRALTGFAATMNNMVVRPMRNLCKQPKQLEKLEKCLDDAEKADGLALAQFSKFTKYLKRSYLAWQVVQQLHKWYKGEQDWITTSSTLLNNFAMTGASSTVVGLGQSLGGPVAFFVGIATAFIVSEVIRALTNLFADDDRTRAIKNAYLALGLQKGKASYRDVREAFKAKAKQHHPDKGGRCDSFVKINTAYELVRVHLHEQGQYAGHSRMREC